MTNELPKPVSTPPNPSINSGAGSPEFERNDDRIAGQLESSNTSAPTLSEATQQSSLENNQESAGDEMSEEEKIAIENYLDVDDPYASEEDEDSEYSGWGDMHLEEYNSDE